MIFKTAVITFCVCVAVHLYFIHKRLDELEKMSRGTVEIIVDRTFDGDTGRHGYKLDKIIHEAKKSQKGMTIASSR